MKVVGFGALKKNKNRAGKKHLFFCVSNVFKNGVVIMGITTFLFLIGIIGGNFSVMLKQCFENFITSMSNFKNILTGLFIL